MKNPQRSHKISFFFPPETSPRMREGANRKISCLLKHNETNRNRIKRNYFLKHTKHGFSLKLRATSRSTPHYFNGRQQCLRLSLSLSLSHYYNILIHLIHLLILSLPLPSSPFPFFLVLVSKSKPSTIINNPRLSTQISFLFSFLLL